MSPIHLWKGVPKQRLGVHPKDRSSQACKVVRTVALTLALALPPPPCHPQLPPTSGNIWAIISAVTVSPLFAIWSSMASAPSTTST